MKNKFVAAVLAIFGGPLGLHKFYLGDSGAGVFYIFLTIMTSNIFPVSFILGVIDGLRYLMMPPAEFERKFSSKYGRRRMTRSRRTKRETSRDIPRAEPRKPRRTGRSGRRETTKMRTRNNPFKKSGLRKYKDFDIEEAIEDFHKALKIDPNDVSIFFNLACAYSLLENKEKAFKYVELAVSRGLRDQERIMTHDDLAFLRIQPEFLDFKTAGFTSKKDISDQSIPSSNEEKPMDDILLAQLNRLMELRKKKEFSRNRSLYENARKYWPDSPL